MANSYAYQFQGGKKPRMTNVEGFVSIGTGGLLNSVIAIPSGGSIAGHSGTYYGTLPGQLTAAAPTGWVGTFSGTWGLYGAGVNGISRVSTGLYSIFLSDDWVRLDSCQVEPVLGAVQMVNGGATGVTSVNAQLAYFTVGAGNSVSTGGYQAGAGLTSASGLTAENTKNQVLIQFSASPQGASGILPSAPVAVDLPLGSGFFVSLRLRDSFNQPVQ